MWVSVCGTTKIVNYDYFKNGPVDSIPEIVPEVTQIAPVKVLQKLVLHQNYRNK